MISAAFPYQKQRRRVLGMEMAYVEMGEGDPLRCCMVMRSRCTSGAMCCRTCRHEVAAFAPDLIGMGDSESCLIVALAHIFSSSTAATTSTPYSRPWMYAVGSPSSFMTRARS
jgi:hypothetical protein